MPMSELDFKRWLRKEWKGWSEAYEPRRGGGVGIPDIQLLVRGKLIPIELKIGEIKDGIVKPREIRADQIGWHKRFMRAGGLSFFLVAQGKSKSPDAIVLCVGDKISEPKWNFVPVKNFEMALALLIRTYEE